MFKEKFNSLYVAVHEFVQNEQRNMVFNEPNEEVKYYKSIVDEFNSLKHNIDNIVVQLAQTDDELKTEIDELIELIDIAFEKYKVKSLVVRSYLYEQSLMPIKISLADSISKFEKQLITEPLIKVDVSEITHIVSIAEEYADTVSQPYYFFSNNPFVLNSDGVIIPIKHMFENKNNFVTNVYNYLYSIYTTYLNTKKSDLASLNNLEHAIENKIYAFSSECNKIKSKNIISNTSEADIFYMAVEEVKEKIKVKKDEIINLGVYRFTRLVSMFETISKSMSDFIFKYESNEKYTAHKADLYFSHLMNKFRDYLVLIEDGLIKVDTSYIVTDFTLKSLVDEIMIVSKNLKRKITYTQKYHDSGKPTDLSFEFYQLEMFETSIKTYYYNLMMGNNFKSTRLSIDDFGDGTIDNLRIKFKKQLADYNKFVSADTFHYNGFEFQTFIDDMLKLQMSLKVAALDFFTAAKKTSLPTYVEHIDNEYSKFLKKLTNDQLELNNQRITETIIEYDKDKNESRKKLIELSDHINTIEAILIFARKNVFVGFVDYLDLSVLPPLKKIRKELMQRFNAENYIDFLTMYQDFYSTNIVDFNLLFAIEKFSEKAMLVFPSISRAEELFIEEITHNKVSYNFGDAVDFLFDLFDDETYKVMRSELFYEMDIVYNFLISKRPNEKSFLLNEKNIKKLFFDNQLLKLNYIRWYHKIQVVLEKYENLDKDALTGNEFYEKNKAKVNDFEQKKRIEALVAAQGKILSELTKMLTEYSADVNYHVDLASDVMKNVESYNLMVVDKFDQLVYLVDKLKNTNEFVDLENLKNKLEKEHYTQWVDIIFENDIPLPEKITFSDNNVFSGNIPFTVGLKAQMETVLTESREEIEATYQWIIGAETFDGNEATYTFYEEGQHDVKCTIKYPDGNSFTKHLIFNLGSAQNSQVVKVGEIVYAPLAWRTEIPKLTFVDPETSILRTVPLNFQTTRIIDYLKDGNITFTPENSGLQAENYGLVILGYTGVEFPGPPYDPSYVFDGRFEYPKSESNEFLFDFKVSAPLSGSVVINIVESKFTKFMTKVPKDVKNVYQISSAEKYTDELQFVYAVPGDKFILKNAQNRFGIVEIKSIKSTVVPGNHSEYHHEIEFKYFINTSMNRYDRDVFSPTVTSLTVPTIIFKTDVREIFNSLILRMEKINEAKTQMTNEIDSSEYNLLLTNVIEMEEENRKFYLFDELDVLKSRYFTYLAKYKSYIKQFSIDFELEQDIIENAVKAYTAHLNETKTFEMSVNSVKAYNFIQNMIDLGVIVLLYKDMISILELLIDTYSYKSYTFKHYSDKLNLIKIFDFSKVLDKNEKSYKKNLIALVNGLRDVFFKMKLIINYPILTNSSYIIFDSNFHRLKKDEVTGEWHEFIESDMFLLHKQIELKYGLEIKKIEEGNAFKPFISDIVQIEKDLFGRGLSQSDIRNLSNYLAIIKKKTVAEYDDFFLIPLWLDYLDKNM